jgi:arginyl-tRNA synthetase
VLVEFSSPNIAKPFHAGHLRSTILGNFLQNVYRATGHNVISYNYLGDWGKQYGLLAIGFERYGSREELQSNPIRHLFDVYVKISADNAGRARCARGGRRRAHRRRRPARAYFARMEAGDADALKMWSEFRSLSIVEYEKIYKRLGVSFDIFSGESQVSDGMEAAFEVMKAKNLLFVNEGATLIDLEPYGKALGKCLIKKRDGTSLYITRDVAAAKGRFDKHQFDKMIYVVGDAQMHHFAQLFQVLKLMDYDWAARCEHVGFGLVNGMSTRKGTAVFLEDILAEAKDVMLEVMKKNEDKFKEVPDPETAADIVGMSAVIVQDLSAKRRKNYDFNWDRMTAFEGETGPYLQYSHARLSSIMRKAGVGLHVDADVSPLDRAAGGAARDAGQQVSERDRVGDLRRRSR